MESLARTPLRVFCFILLLSYCTLWFRLGALPFIGADEPRYARIAEEMWRDGRWVTPTLEGHPWLEKPPLYYWITIPFYAVFGVSEWSARAGAATMAVVAALALYSLGAFLYSRMAGLLAAAILVTSIGFAVFGRGASTDMPMTAAYTVAMAFLCMAAARPVPLTWLSTGYFFMGLAVLAKGPVALILALGTMLLFWLLDERGGAFKRWRVPVGLLVISATALPWFWLVFRENGYSFILVFLINHNLARYVSDMHHHPGPFYYYLVVLPGLMFPWTAWLQLLIPSRMLEAIQGWKTWDRGTVFLGCWALFPFFFFSLSESKLPGYILPSMPPIALLLGRRLAHMWQSQVGRSHTLLPGLSLGVSALLSIALAIWLGRQYEEVGRGLLLAAIVFVPGIIVFAASRSRRWDLAMRATMAQGVVLVASLATLGFPGIAVNHSARDIAFDALRSRTESEPIVTYGYFHHTLNYYTGYRVAQDLTSVEALNAFLQRHSRFILVTKMSRLEELRALGEQPDRGFAVSVLTTRARLCVLRVSRR